MRRKYLTPRKPAGFIDEPDGRRGATTRVTRPVRVRGGLDDEASAADPEGDTIAVNSRRVTSMREPKHIDLAVPVKTRDCYQHLPTVSSR